MYATAVQRYAHIQPARGRQETASQPAAPGCLGIGKEGSGQFSPAARPLLGPQVGRVSALIAGQGNVHCSQIGSQFLFVHAPSSYMTSYTPAGVPVKLNSVCECSILYLQWQRRWV